MDRITRVRIKNVRAIESVDLELGRPVTVLIGENGSGKSTILECLELLRKAAEPGFMAQLYAQHRGMPGLLRKGAPSLELGVVIEDDAGKLPRIEYAFALAPRVAGAVVEYERMLVGPMNNADKPLVALRRTALKRTADRGEMFDQKEGKLVPVPPEAMKPDQLVVASFGSLPPQKAIERLLHVLRGIEVHLPFDTVAAWAARAYQLSKSLRSTTMLLPAERLDLLGFNLANAWSEINNGPSERRDHAHALVRLGLGEHIDSVVTKADPGGGHVALALTVQGLAEPIMAADLSDGQLSWLAFIALTRLNPGRALLAVDEPELHLHPSLLGRVVTMLARLPGGAPVLLSTHSDRVLELLDDPADAVRVCSLIGSRAEVSRIDAEQLLRWLEQFGDLGQLRAAGYLSRVLVPTPPVASDDEGGE
jgi:predicted ATPase